jgi:peptidoglycan hydrolase CwlO-like protein
MNLARFVWLKNFFCLFGAFLILSAFLYFKAPFNITNVFAADEVDVSAKIKELEEKIAKAQNQAGSLSREINILENNIELKTIQIKKAEAEITKKEEELGLLREDIRLLEIRLERLDETISYHQKLLGERLKQEYINKQKNSFLELVLSAKGVGDFMSQISYLKKVQAEDNVLLGKMDETKDSYEDQQTLLEEKKNEVEKIKQEIEYQRDQANRLKATLEQQKEEKDALLRVTKNDEKRYQDLLAAAKRELDQISGAASIVVREGKGVDVEEGEVIGTMGNSGFSTGAHLHFSIYKYSEGDFAEKSSWGWYYTNYVDPLKYLKSKEIYWGTGCYRDPKGTQTSGSGDYSWPMKSPRITQNYGSQTCYNWMYGGKVHPALDMVGIGDISIRSVADGKAYFCRNCLGDGGNGVFVFHDGDKMSVYWHLK